MALHKERVERWIAALESGNYRQARGRLRREDGFCCLGVACDISNEGKWEGDKYLGCAMFLPEWLSDQFGVSRPIETHLMQMNDAGQPFSEIAAYLRQRLAEQSAAVPASPSQESAEP